MPVTVRCPLCSTRLKVGSKLIGTKVKCPKCGKPFDAQEEAAVPVPVKVTPPKPAPLPPPPQAPMPSSEPVRAVVDEPLTAPPQPQVVFAPSATSQPVIVIQQPPQPKQRSASSFAALIVGCLAILVCFFRNRGTIAVEDINVMKG